MKALIGLAITVFLFGACTGGTDPPAAEPEVRTFEQAVQKALVGTVQVQTADASGTAFYIGGSEFVTAAHVVQGASEVTLIGPSERLTARLIGVSEERDIALLMADVPADSLLKPLEWGDIASVQIGQTVGVAGFAGGSLGDAAITRGSISRLFEEDGLDIIQTDAAANPGDRRYREKLVTGV